MWMSSREAQYSPTYLPVALTAGQQNGIVNEVQRAIHG